MNTSRLNPEIEGFTLIEIMIVISILGILAAIAIPNYISYRNKAYCTAAENDAVNILLTLTGYYSIANHNNAITGFIPSNGAVLGGLTFPVLSRGNTANLTAVGLIHTVVVTDGSANCPLDYRVSAVASGWSLAPGGGTYTKFLR